LNKVLSFISNFLNCVAIAGICYFAINYPPAPVNADTTGVMPEFEVVDIEQHKYLMDTELGNYTKDDVSCLVENMYFEARSDGYAGMYAVTMVVMNRVADHRYPDTVCGVIHQGPVRESWKTRGKDVADSERKYWPIKNRCQFSWYCDGKADVMYNEEAVYLATDIALLVLDISTSRLGDTTFLVDITEGSTHYHTDYVKPAWRHDRGMAKITSVGTHIFYRWN
tara:strand:+ start:1886 stop:2557 length:672 start_codon:yes stop_codon:yes gene_type:complete